MKLAILVNTDRNLEVVIGLSTAAARQGHEVNVFAMDEGTRLLEQPSYVALSSQPRVRMAFCEHSAEKLGAGTGGLDTAIVAGSQYNNAAMMHDADRVIVL